MKKNYKRFLAALLTLCMLVGMVPVTASAEETYLTGENMNLCYSSYPHPWSALAADVYYGDNYDKLAYCDSDYDEAECYAWEYADSVFKSTNAEQGYSYSSMCYTTPEGSYDVSFQWCCSSEGSLYDIVEVVVDGQIIEIFDSDYNYSDGAPSEGDWYDVTVHAYGDAAHTICWIYHKDSSYEEGNDSAWVRNISVSEVHTFKQQGTALIAYTENGENKTYEMDGNTLTYTKAYVSELSVQYVNAGEKEVCTLVVDGEEVDDFNGEYALDPSESHSIKLTVGYDEPGYVNYTWQCWTEPSNFTDSDLPWLSVSPDMVDAFISDTVTCGEGWMDYGEGGYVMHDGAFWDEVENLSVLSAEERSSDFSLTLNLERDGFFAFTAKVCSDRNDTLTFYDNGTEVSGITNPMFDEKDGDSDEWGEYETIYNCVVPLAKGEHELTFRFTKGARPYFGDTLYSYAELRNFYLAKENAAYLTFRYDEDHGNVTIDGEAVADGEKIQLTAGEKHIMQAVPADGYAYDHAYGDFFGSSDRNPFTFTLGFDEESYVVALFTEAEEPLTLLPIDGFTPPDGITVGCLDDEEYYKWSVTEIDDKTALVSGNAGIISTEAALVITAQEAGLLSFDYKIESPDTTCGLYYRDNEVPSVYDDERALNATLDYKSTQRDGYTGSIGWTQERFYLQPGDTIYIAYAKGSTNTTGRADCAWLSNFKFETKDDLNEPCAVTLDWPEFSGEYSNFKLDGTMYVKPGAVMYLEKGSTHYFTYNQYSACHGITGSDGSMLARDMIERRPASYAFTVTGDVDYYADVTWGESYAYVPIAGEDLGDPGIEWIRTKDDYPWTLGSDGYLVSGNQNVVESVSVIAVKMARAGKLMLSYNTTVAQKWEGLFYNINHDLEHDNCDSCYDLEDLADSVKKDSRYYDLSLDKYSIQNSYYEEISGVTSGERTLELTDLNAGDIVYIGHRTYTSTSATSQTKLKVYTTTDRFNVTATASVGGMVSGTPEGGSAPSGKTITLTAAPDSGYMFLGWKLGADGAIFSTDPVYTFNASGNVAYYAEFAPIANIAVKTVTGSGTFAYYESLATALAAAQSGDTLYVLKDAALTADTTIPAGVTVILSCMDNDPGIVNGHNPDGTSTAGTVGVGPNAHKYMTLTIPADKTLTVNGTLIVNAVTGRPGAGHYDQDVTGGYAQIDLAGSITVNGTLKNYGYIEGSGSITANSGATVGDLYITRNWRGGSQAAYQAYDNFYPMNEYDLHNITVPVTINNGANYKALVKMFASGAYYYTEFPQVGANALIQPAAGASVVKTFENGREKYTVNGDTTFGASTLTIVGRALSTGDYVYPWDGDMDFEIAEGTTTFAESFKFMPGATFTVKDNANITVNSGKTVVFYDDDVFNDVANTDNTQYPDGRGNAKLNIGKNVTVTNNGALVGEMNFPDDIGTGSVTGSVWTATTKEANGYMNGSKAYTFSSSFNRPNHTGKIVEGVLVWTANECTITFNSNGGSAVDPITAAVGAAVSAPAAPTKAGYVFDGWYKDDGTFANAYTLGTMGTENITLYAKWTPATDTAYKVEHYWQNVADDNYTLKETENLSGTTATTVTATPKSYEGFTYDESVVGTIKSATIAADGSLVLKLYYTRNSYTLTWDVNGGNALTSTGHTTGSVKYGTDVTKPTNDPTKTGYDFSGWQNYTDSMTMPAADTTMTAQWTAKKFTVTFNANGGECDTKNKEVTYAGTYGDLPTPTRTGYTFGGWFDGQNEVKSTDTVAITAAQTLTAQWTANTYTVTFNSDGGSACDPITVTYGQAYGTLPIPEKTGYKFKGWYLNDNKLSDDSTFTSTENVTLVAQWTAASYNVRYFVDDVEQESKEQTYDYGEKLSLITYTKTGYAVSAWVYKIDGVEQTMPENMPAINMRLYATTSIINYTITYNLDDGTNAEGNPATYTVETEAFTLSDPTKTGYTFLGWTTPISSTPTKSVTVTKGGTGDLTFTANWQVNSHTVTYTVDGETKYSENVNYGSEVVIKADETKTGYTFSGWKIDATDAADFTMPDSDVIISGTFTANSYTVKFDANGGEGSMADQNFTYDAAQNLTANAFTKTGYTFDGWKIGDTTYTDAQSVNNLTAEADGTVTLVAQWNVNKYTITFDLGCVPATDIDPIEADYGTEVKAPADPECKGYIFKGWDKDIPATMPAENITIKALWTSYADLFDALENFEGDNLSLARDYYAHMNEDQIDECGDKVELLLDAIEEYSVDKMKNAVIDAITPTNLTLIDSDDSKPIATLSNDGENIDVRLIKEDFLASKMLEIDFLKELFRYGEIISADIGSQTDVEITQMALMLSVAMEAGVDLSTAQTAVISVLDGETMEVTLHAKTVEGVEYSVTYTLSFFNDTHEVTWDADGGELSGDYTSGSTAFGTEITAPTATKTGYTFAGWDKTVETVMGKTALSYKATWTVNEYTITFKDGDDTLKTLTQDYGTAVAAPENPAKTGYTFNGWSPVVPATMPAECMTLTAQWIANTYTVKFNANGGEGSMADQVFTYDAEQLLTANAFTKTGYTFDGWKLGETTYTDAESVNNLTAENGATITMTAQWIANEYTVTFNADGGECDTANKKVTYGSTYGDLPTPTRTGYTFGGWFDGENEIKADTKVTITADQTLKAKWTINSYKVTYIVDGETVKEETYEYASTITPYTYSKTGYDVSTWNQTVPAMMPAENLTFTATTTVHKHTVTYTIDGETKYSENVNYGFEVTLKAAETKTGYTFSGWSVTGATAEDGKFTMPDSDVTISGTFMASSYTVKFGANGGEGTMVDQTFTYDAEQALTANAFTKTGYTFDGWKLGETTYTDAQSVSNLTAEADGFVTLTAQWKITEYKVTTENTTVYEDDDDSIARTTVEYTQDFEARTVTFTVSATENGKQYNWMVSVLRDGEVKETIEDVNGVYTITDVYSDVCICVESVLIGDIDLDGFVNSLDATILAQTLAGIAGVNISEAISQKAADCNSDGDINAMDATMIAQHLAGIKELARTDDIEK